MRWLQRWFRRRQRRRERARVIAAALELFASENTAARSPITLANAALSLQHRLQAAGHRLALSKACRLIRQQWQQQDQQSQRRRRQLTLIK